MKRPATRTLLAGGLLLALPACAQTGKARPDVEAMFPNACYSGIDAGGDVCLKDGRSAGPPVVELGPQRASGDLDGDGAPETALLLTRDPKSPDQQVYLVVAALRGDRIATLAAAPLGSSVNVSSFEIRDGQVHIGGQRSASARTAMMPVSLAFSLREGKLVEGKP
jgi:hypothetical protein